MLIFHNFEKYKQKNRRNSTHRKQIAAIIRNFHRNENVGLPIPSLKREKLNLKWNIQSLNYKKFELSKSHTAQTAKLKT